MLVRCQTKNQHLRFARTLIARLARMRTLLRTLSIVAVALAFAGCKSKGDAVVDETFDEPVYTRVGMRFDMKRGRYLMYSTNYIGMPHYLPPNTELTLRGVNRKGIELRNADGDEFFISYVSKHSKMPIGEWRETNFSSMPVTLPNSLTDDERDAISSGDVRPGMSRQALFLALGYPPKSTNPSLDANTLIYETHRMRRRSIVLDGDDKVASIGR